jgi:hypothetical protein
VQVTVVVPTGKVDPEAGEHETFEERSPSTSSVAERVYETLAPPGPVASAGWAPVTEIVTVGAFAS